MIHYSKTEVKRCLIMYERNASYISHVLFKSQVDAVLSSYLHLSRWSPSLWWRHNVWYLLLPQHQSSHPIFSSYQSCEGGGWDWLCWYRGQLWWHQRVSNEYFSDLSCHLYFLFCNIILIYSQGCRLVWRTCPNMWSSSRLCMLRASGQSR